MAFISQWISLIVVEGEAGETQNVVGKESAHPDAHETFVQVGCMFLLALDLAEMFLTLLLLLFLRSFAWVMPAD